MALEAIGHYIHGVKEYFWPAAESEEQLVLNEIAKLPNLTYDKNRLAKEIDEIKANWITKRFSAQRYAYNGNSDGVSVDDLPDLFRLVAQTKAFERASLDWKEASTPMFSAKVLQIAKNMPEVRFASNLVQSNLFVAAKKVQNQFEKVRALRDSEAFASESQQLVQDYSYFIFAMKREMENYVLEEIEIGNLLFDYKEIPELPGAFHFREKSQLTQEEKVLYQQKMEQFNALQKNNVDIDYFITCEFADLVKKDIEAGKIIDIRWEHLQEARPKKLLSLILLKMLTTSKNFHELPKVEAFWQHLDEETINYLHKTLYQFEPIHYKVIQFMLVQGGAKHLTDSQIRYLHHISPVWAMRIEWFVEEILEVSKQVALDEKYFGTHIFQQK